jgi:cardiolipin synthase
MPTDLPNLLTLSRIAAIPVLVALVALRHPWGDVAACAVFSAAAITDYFDGKIARERRTVSGFGRMFDPIADKLLVGAALMLLAGMGRLSDAALYPAIVVHAAGDPGVRPARVPGLAPDRPARHLPRQVEDGVPDGRARHPAGRRHRRGRCLYLGFLPVSLIGEAMLWAAAGAHPRHRLGLPHAGLRHAAEHDAAGEPSRPPRRNARPEPLRP